MGGLLQIVVVKRGSHSFSVRLPDSQLAGLFVPTRDCLPYLADNRTRGFSKFFAQSSISAVNTSESTGSS